MRATLLSVLLFCAAALAQVPNPTSQAGQPSAPPQADTSGNVPVFRVQVVDRTVSAINYFHRSGSTKIGFRGTELDPQADGGATVESRRGRMVIDAKFDHLRPASSYGSEYLTYVLWAITPEGRAQNLGELLLDGSKSAVNVTTDLQSFGLIVTAEPYYAVTVPSDAVVAENVVLPAKTQGIIEPITAKYELLPRGQYTLHADQALLKPDRHEQKIPLELREARNAVELARASGADQYSADSLSKAEVDLQNAEGLYKSKSSSKQVATYARQAVQDAEDARVITVRRKADELARQQREQTEQARSQAEEAQRAQASAEEQQRHAEEQQRAAEEQRRAESARAEQESQRAQQAQQDLNAAQQAREQAQQELAAAQQARSEAETARQAALAQQQQAEQRASQAEQEKDALRARLQQQLNTILETRESARGLIVNMSDVLFDTGKYTLRSGTREKLARVGGILSAYPGLKVQVEGYTDSTGTVNFNQTLSEKRAATVRDYLVGQGINMTNVSAQGFGEAMPVADNATAAGRQQNRRVQLVVSGEPIGVETQQPTQNGNRTLQQSSAPQVNPAQPQPGTRQPAATPPAIGAPVQNPPQQQPGTPQVPK